MTTPTLRYQISGIGWAVRGGALFLQPGTYIDTSLQQWAFLAFSQYTRTIPRTSRAAGITPLRRQQGHPTASRRSRWCRQVCRSAGRSNARGR
jgi:hypothetical protein